MFEPLPGIANAVLLVNSHQSIRTLLRHWLERSVSLPLPVRVEAVADAESAWAALESGSFDVAIIAHELGDENGASLIRRMRQSDRFRHIPCILESPRPLGYLVGPAREAGADFVVSLVDHTANDLAVMLAEALHRPALRMCDDGFPDGRGSTWNRAPR